MHLQKNSHFEGLLLTKSVTALISINSVHCNDKLNNKLNKLNLHLMMLKEVFLNTCSIKKQ